MGKRVRRRRHHATVASQEQATWPLRSLRLQGVINVFCYVYCKFEVAKWLKEISDATKNAKSSNYFNTSFSVNKPMRISEDDVEQNEEKEDSDEEFDSSEKEIEESEEEYVPAGENKVLILFTQNDLNNLIRRIGNLMKKEKNNFGNTIPNIRKPHFVLLRGPRIAE
ncbi:hypothetical protein ILUMI_23229 [Ignelater luminosus]|uniref:Uncharacterized protein n=1 Tax=Ignelater luminosus TaxID=2038154 RepID=A0A8K0FZT5_IGNLU|nr:hypothetical protein ILUMI_23229 [Ignelater luminosus]